MLLPQEIEMYRETPSDTLKVHADSGTHASIRATEVRTLPITTIPPHGHPANRLTVQLYLSIAITSIAIPYLTTISFLMSTRYKYMKGYRYRFGATRLNQNATTHNKTESRKERLLSTKYTAFLISMILCSYFLWSFEALHATLRFLWSLIQTVTYTISRWALEHPSTTIVAASNIILGFNAFDALFINLQKHQTAFVLLGHTIFSTITDLFRWRPISVFQVKPTFSLRLTVQGISLFRGYDLRQLGLLDMKPSRTMLWLEHAVRQEPEQDDTSRGCS